MELKGSKTEKNLLTAFAGESQAKNRYTFFAKVAKNEGYEQIAAIFEETAAQEQQHAKMIFKHLQGGMVEITATYPAGVIADTASNLLAAAMGEKEEYEEMYPTMANVAEEEGFQDIAVMFRMIGKAETHHEERFLKLLKNVKEDAVFQRGDKVYWYCRKCGYVHYGAAAPMKCPACGHPQAYYQLKVLEY
ncbi:MAG: rubrerythrin family protein [Bacteroidales bacterium]|jgi:rubrerythrin|nr:rubrerythrin family protein [Bacteroidales bacterium]